MEDNLYIFWKLFWAPLWQELLMLENRILILHPHFNNTIPNNILKQICWIPAILQLYEDNRWQMIWKTTLIKKYNSFELPIIRPSNVRTQMLLNTCMLTTLVWRQPRFLWKRVVTCKTYRLKKKLFCAPLNISYLC